MNLCFWMIVWNIRDIKSDTSIRIGLTNLLQNEIIARGRHESLYFINPMVTFNGNRITFAKTYVKKKSIFRRIKERSILIILTILTRSPM